MRFAGRAPIGYWLAFAALLALAVYLRLQQIGIQWLTDDEWHAVHKLVSTDGYLPILLSFGGADYSIPLTVLYKFLSVHGGLTELKMRLPMLVGGTVFVALAVTWVRARIDGRTALVFGFLLAISPILVNYSRYARPYMLTLLLAAVAVWALARWERHGRSPDAAVYIACAWAGSYLHLIMAPFNVGLLAPLFLRRIWGQGTRPWLPLLAVSGLAAAGIAGLCLPPLLHDMAAMGTKTGSDLPQLDTLIGVWHIWLGTNSFAVVLLGITLAALGLATLRHHVPLELASWLCGSAGILAAILVMQPAYVQYPLVFGRYLLPLQTLFLLLIAAGIIEVTRRIAVSSMQGWAAAAMSALFLAGTPLLSLLRYPNNFTLHSYYQFDYRKRHSPVREELNPFAEPSPFWRRFAQTPPGAQRIAVAGAVSFETLFVFHLLYQPLHRQLLYSLQTGAACGPARPGEAYPSQGIILRNAVSLGLAEDIRQKKIDWVILESRYMPWYARATQEEHQAYLDACNRFLAARFGPPVYEDQYLKAYRVQVADSRGS